MLILNLEQRLNFFSNCSAFSTDFKSCSIRVKSSANMVSLIILLSILIPFVFFSYLILLARISIVKINRYAYRGQPCLTPLSNLKYLPVLTLLITVDSILLYIILIYSIICSPKFTCFNTFNKKFQFKESKAFSISILKKSALVCICPVKKEISCKSLVFSPIFKKMTCFILGAEQGDDSPFLFNRKLSSQNCIFNTFY